MKIILVILLALGSAFTEDWQVNKDADNSVVFISSTTFLDFEGKTHEVDGYIYWQGEQPFEDYNEFYFEVPLYTFKTGITQRDIDLQTDVLETDIYPVASYQGNFINVIRVKDGFDVTVKGIMNLHGVKKAKEIKGHIDLKKNEMIVETHFTVLLNDYNIDAPQLLSFFKVADEIKLEVKFHLGSKIKL